MKDAAVPHVVSREQWERDRAELLLKEKEHTKLGDAIAASRRRLPMTPMDSLSVVGANGNVPLQDVFEGRRMLVVYHFMWKKNSPLHKQCEGCTFSQVAMNAAVVAYLNDRDVTYAVFSSGPYSELQEYRDFMGWTTPWYSTEESAAVLATRDGGDLRVYLSHEGNVFQTYETKWRGIEAMMPSLQLLDMTPWGRQETWEDSPVTVQLDRPGTWWRRDGRPVAQWTRTDKPIS